jgi:hypothetical protein
VIFELRKMFGNQNETVREEKTAGKEFDIDDKPAEYNKDIYK